jgi:DNA-directed RNA polymerase subunit L
MNKPLIIGYIYSLRHPLSRNISYIGQTKRNVNIRLEEHISKALKAQNTILYKWVKNILDDDVKPIIEILECIYAPYTLNEKEKYWVKHYEKESTLVNTLLTKPDINASEYSINFIPKKTGDRIKLLKKEIKDLIYKGISYSSIRQMYTGNGKNGFNRGKIMEDIIKEIFSEIIKSHSYKLEWEKLHNSIHVQMLKNPSNHRYFNSKCPDIIA